MNITVTITVYAVINLQEADPADVIMGVYPNIDAARNSLAEDLEMNNGHWVNYANPLTGEGDDCGLVADDGDTIFEIQSYQVKV